MTEAGCDISVLLPVFNERENIRPLYEELRAVLDGLSRTYEIVFVDDGSSDGSGEALRNLAEADARCVVIHFRRNFGQTAALSAAFAHARGRVLVTMDADRQNDPHEIPKLLRALDGGADCASGWRRERKDKWLTRRVPSMLANRLLSWWTGLSLHDYGCSLKAYRAEVVQNVKLYGEMHRFVPLYAWLNGGKVEEVVVNHRPRVAGTSKYGLMRTFRVLLDMVTLKLLGSYSAKPMYFFGGVGFALLALAFAIVAFVVGERVLVDELTHKMSLLLMSTMFTTVGVLLVMMGLLAELLIRLYHETTGREIYIVREVRDRRAALAARDEEAR